MKILFLTNNKNSEDLIKWLRNEAKEEVIFLDKKITEKDILLYNPKWVISYNYKHIIRENILDMLPNRFINLHISYLPWNRGANPNVWSFLEGTPKGVTIHLIDKNIDTGRILLQKKLIFNEETETLESTYRTLHKEIQEMFKNNWNEIRKNEIKSTQQSKGGSLHYKKEFKKISKVLGNKGWKIPIIELKNNYKSLRKEK